MKFAGYDIHPVANLFPMMGEDDYSDLKSDIAKNGQIQKIVLLDGKILDGRNRALACHELGIKPRVTEWDGAGSPIDWVISANLKRRHLTASQRAAIAVDSLPLYEAEAAERRRATQNNKPPEVEKIPPQDCGKARDKAAAATGVNPRYVSDAKKVKREAPDVFEKVKTGAVTIQAAKTAIRPIPATKLSPVEQKKIDEASEDSEALWLLKDTWRKTTKSDRKKFLLWTNRNGKRK